MIFLNTAIPTNKNNFRQKGTTTFSKSLNICDKFEKNISSISFKGEHKLCGIYQRDYGKYFASGFFENGEIEEAKNEIKKMSPDWRTKTIENQTKENWDSHLFSLKPVRAGLAIVSWGTSEIFVIPDAKKICREDAEKHVNHISLLIQDLQAEAIEKEEIQAERRNQAALNLVQLETKKQAIKDRLTKGYSDLIELEQKGKSVPIPNCIMLAGESEDIPREIIDWAGKNSDCDFKIVSNHSDSSILQENLSTALDSAEENYKKTKRRTLIHVEGFDKLINPQHNSEANIECMKDIMGSCSKDNHSTIIFSTKDTSVLNQITIQPHRVQEIPIDILSESEEIAQAPVKKAKKIADARARLNNVESITKKPLDAINDLIFLFIPDEKKPLKPGYSSYEFKRTEAIFINMADTFDKPENKTLKTVLEFVLTKLKK